MLKIEKLRFKKLKNIVISPSGNFYGSEQVLYDFLKTNEVSYKVFAPRNSIFFEILTDISNKHSLNHFSSVYDLYLRILINLIFKNTKSVYLNEGAHIKWIFLLAKLFKNVNFVVHLRIVEDINRIPNRLTKNIKIVTISKFMFSQIDKKHTSFLVYDPYTFTDNEIDFFNKDLPFRIGIIGRISINKGILEISKLVRAIAKSNHPLAKCIVIKFYGTENKDKVTHEITSELKLNYKDLCHFVGFVETIEIYKNVDMVLHLARHEPLGRIFFEALDVGLPFLGFKSGGIGELGKIAKLEYNLVEYDEHNWVNNMLQLIFDLIENYDNNKQTIIETKKKCKNYFNQETYNISLNKIIENKIQ